MEDLCHRSQHLGDFHSNFTSTQAIVFSTVKLEMDILVIESENAGVKTDVRVPGSVE